MGWSAQEEADDILEKLTINSTQSPRQAAPASAYTATLRGFDSEGRPMVSGLYQESGDIVHARTTVPLVPEWIGASVVVLCENNDIKRPIIVGVLQQARPQVCPPPFQLSVQADGERYVISAEHELILRCGKASITLTRAGKVLIRGAYVLSHSSGVNRVKGGSVQIN
jgi:hypothetical protein